MTDHDRLRERVGDERYLALAANGVDLDDYEDFIESAEDDLENGDGVEHADPERLEDAHVAETIAGRALQRFVWTGRGSWLRYRRGRWIEAPESLVSEVIRIDVIDMWEAEARAGANADRLKAITALMSGPRIRSITRLCEGIRFVDGRIFDGHRDLLNVGNGVVDLQTGELRRHDPKLYFTKITQVRYDPDAWSADWHLALEAVPEEVRDWLHLRLGQAITGHRTSDDVLPILQGGGSNGKTTITGAVFKALGDHAVLIPERSLLTNRGDHPTEMMPFKGARFALIEETPEARHLNVKRLKDVVGTPTMTARRVFHDNETWDTTHSLFITTNYRPRVDEVDHGTWRRLALVSFPYRFVPADEVAGPLDRAAVDGLRERLHAGRHGEHEAVLAWLIEGAKWWYAQDQLMQAPPQRVRDDTFAWRQEADVILNFCIEELVFEADWHVMSRDLYARFADWMVARGHQKPSDQTFSSRFQNHSLVAAARVERRQIKGTPGLLSRPRWGVLADGVPARYMAWLGVRFRVPSDDENEGD